MASMPCLENLAIVADRRAEGDAKLPWVADLDCPVRMRDDSGRSTIDLREFCPIYRFLGCRRSARRASIRARSA
jgi:hypothetical protein